MDAPPFEVQVELKGWKLFWAHMEAQAYDPGLLAAAGGRVVDQVRSEMQLEPLSAHPTIAGLRRLFKAADEKLRQLVQAAAAAKLLLTAAG